jgi:predicted porin
MKATISGAFVANKNFALNVDYTLGLSKPKYKVQGTPESDLNSFFNNQFKNLSELKVGGEYRYNNFRLRGGYAIANSPFEKIYGENNFIGKKETLGAGVGFDFKSFYVDAAYNRVKTNSTNVYGDGKYYFENTEIVYNAIPFTSNLEDIRNIVTLTVGWKF